MTVSSDRNTTIQVDYRILYEFAKSKLNDKYGGEFSYLVNIIHPSKGQQPSIGKCHSIECKRCYVDKTSHYSCGRCHKQFPSNAQSFMNHITRNKCNINVLEFFKDYFNWYHSNNQSSKVIYAGLNIDIKNKEKKQIIKLILDSTLLMILVVSIFIYL